MSVGKNSDGKNRLVAGMRYAALGLEFSGIIVGALILGYHADAYLGTAPVFLVLFIAGGFTGALRRLLWSLKRDKITKGA